LERGFSFPVFSFMEFFLRREKSVPLISWRTFDRRCPLVTVPAPCCCDADHFLAGQLDTLGKIELPRVRSNHPIFFLPRYCCNHPNVSFQPSPLVRQVFLFGRWFYGPPFLNRVGRRASVHTFAGWLLLLLLQFPQWADLFSALFEAFLLIGLGVLGFFFCVGVWGVVFWGLVGFLGFFFFFFFFGGKLSF